MKKKTRHIQNIVHGILCGMLIFIGSFTFVYAEQTPYSVLAPLPGTNAESTNCVPKPDGTGCTSDLGKYLPGLFNIVIGVGAIAAFVVITLYGLELMLTDSLVTKQNAKGMIENALWGLGLIIFAYVILYTINPNLIAGNLNISTPKISAGVGGGMIASSPYPNPCAGGVSSTRCVSDTTNRQQLTSNTGIKVANACDGIKASGCTNLDGVTQKAILGTLELQRQCSCVTITGATEHQPGNMIDMASNPTLNSYITSGPIPPANPIDKTLNGQKVTFTFEKKGDVSTLIGGGTVTASGDHWHVNFY